MIEIILLGMAQDGGVPQAGCGCPTCTEAWRDSALRQKVVALGVIDHDTGQCWLIDATPDFREQLHHLGVPLSGIFLTHAHIGHYTGLIHVGKEAWNTRGLPVYATSSMQAFLRSNAPWSALEENRNIALYDIQAGVAIVLSPTLSITPIAVPHRAEYSDTMAFLIRGPHKTLFYCPDIDMWATATWRIDDHLVGVDIVLVDGTFFSAAELPNRTLAEIPHPLVTTTLKAFTPPPSDAVFIHLNHSNPLWRDGTERNEVVRDGWRVGKEGDSWQL